jgi:ABC-type cobalamin/Fe3+-siderophores transport system ATPase subunit
MLEKSENRITYFAQTNFRNEAKVFGIRRADRRSHVYILGKTGVGKSTLLETLIRQDIENGEGLASRPSRRLGRESVTAHLFQRARQSKRFRV